MKELKIIIVILIITISQTIYSQTNKDIVRDVIVENYITWTKEKRAEFIEHLKLQIFDKGVKAQYAEELYNTILAKETLGIIAEPVSTYEDNLKNIKNGNNTALFKELIARREAKKDLNFSKDSDEAMFLDFYDAKLLLGETDKEQIISDYIKSKK